ncbi:MAG: carbohydrate ABC transporter permease [Chloroflexota bacterium]
MDKSLASSGTRAPRWEGGAVLERLFPALSLLPLVAMLVLFTIYPLAQLITLSVSTLHFANGEAVQRFVGLANFAKIPADAEIPSAVINTAIFVVSAVLVEFVLGLALAVAASSVRRGGQVLKAILIIPILVPPLVVGTVWRLMYNPDIGVIDAILRGLGLPPQNWLSDSHYALAAVIGVDVWHWTSFLFLILLAGLQTIPQDPMEAARVDGASAGQVFRSVTLPLLKPTIIVAILFRAVFAFKVFDEIFLLTNGGPGTATEILSLYIYRVVFQFTQFGYGAALSLLTIALVLVALIGFNRTVRTAASRA